ncbi:hypothetical protein, conserved [Leishmania tarentolae]|uniref:Uncharacterized protein n=1 Tax=Leishmania tarentolae TaxID=5689 RepID=A0A640KI54_LEITA|nr:hypothetical protein, conserved [Leishmania tarentolae]
MEGRGQGGKHTALPSPFSLRRSGCLSCECVVESAERCIPLSRGSASSRKFPLVAGAAWFSVCGDLAPFSTLFTLIFSSEETCMAIVHLPHLSMRAAPSSRQDVTLCPTVLSLSLSPSLLAIGWCLMKEQAHGPHFVCCTSISTPTPVPLSSPRPPNAHGVAKHFHSRSFLHKCSSHAGLVSSCALRGECTRAPRAAERFEFEPGQVVTMAINETPHLTNRVVALLMVAVFILCLCADRLQCQNNRWRSMCIGRLAYECSSEWCRSLVVTPTSISWEKSCVGKGDAVVLIALVEVGPSVVSRRGSNISGYMADELRQQIDTGKFQRAVQQTLAAPDVVSDSTGHDARTSLTQLFREKVSFRAIFGIPRNRTRYMVVNDVVPLPEVDALRSLKYTTWEEAVDAALPVSKVDDASQLPRYFPNLYDKLMRLSNERTASTAPSSWKKCDALIVVVCTIAHPLASVRSVWQTPQKAATQLSVGHEYVRGAVTRYLMTCRKSLRYVHEVYYLQYESRLPAWAFTAGVVGDQPDGPLVITATNATAGRAPAPNNISSLAAALCAPANASTPPASLPACEQTCQMYGDIAADLISSDRSIFQKAFEKHLQLSSSFPAYNCYYEVLAEQGEAPINGTFDTNVVARVFDDCLHLSPAGGRAYARCLLRR